MMFKCRKRANIAMPTNSAMHVNIAMPANLAMPMFLTSPKTKMHIWKCG